MTTRTAAVLALCAGSIALAQPTGTSPLNPPPNGPRHADPTAHAIVNATVHAAPGKTDLLTSILIRDGRIERVARPTDAEAFLTDGYHVHDAEGLHVYAGFIEPYLEVTVPAPPADAIGRHWDDGITPRRSALDAGRLDAGAAKTLRDIGFVAAAISPAGGNIRGTSAVVPLADVPGESSADKPQVYRDHVYMAMSFDTGGWGGGYPTSGPGAVALIRQCLIDADWQMEFDLTETSNDLTPLEEWDQLYVFDLSHEQQGEWVLTIAHEFPLERTAVVGTGREFRRLPIAGALAELGSTLIIPLNFPDKPDVASLASADSTSLEDLMAWEQAPTNLRRLDALGARIALTASGLDKKPDFLSNLRESIKAGLDPDRALAMLTTQPAELVGIDHLLGTIEPDKIASLVITDGPIEDAKTKIRDVWVEGRRYEVNAPPPQSLKGDWAMTSPAMPRALEGGVIHIKDDQNKKIALTVPPEDKELNARQVKAGAGKVSFVVDTQLGGLALPTTVSAVLVGDELIGSINAGDKRVEFIATRTEAEPEETTSPDDEHEDADADEPEDKPAADEGNKGGDDQPGGTSDDDARFQDIPEILGVPFGPYARTALPDQPDLLIIRGATIWTSAETGIIEEGEVEIQGGTITYVGKVRRTPVPDDAVLVEAFGKHLTPGLIDCHSHTGLFRFGVNEGGQAVTAECRMNDCVDPDDIAWYRQLAGGVTTVNSLHGSANPIGGQNAVHKIRWGAPLAHGMLLEGAKPGIKFALGENVKRGNSYSDGASTRYPQTRMGVEALIRDRFITAREYAEAERSRAPFAHPQSFRRDLELEALAEILAGDRIIHCHSYRQDEILMLARIADEFGFKIGTYQHGLECYKVAEAVREHAIGASIFSDWWAYKVEVQDAIPYAGPILYEQGVTVSFNSDDNELARRMNDEAAKAVKYGGLAPEEALKFVTINPATQLMIDDRVGSIEVGKDGDLALWSGDPLSSLSMCEATYIDGRAYFTLAQDLADRERIAAERERIIAKLLAEPAKGAGGRPEGDRPEGPGGVDSPRRRRPPQDLPFASAYLLSGLTDEQLDLVYKRYDEMLDQGLDPSLHQCGQCEDVIGHILSGQ